ncbi:MAG: cache domain-containing protein [Syntrophorhabdaceae bacterium]|nr:cache domain-containing protein [Syntrophorhabdaceae bacterium]
MKKVVLLSVICFIFVFFGRDVLYAAGTPAEAEAMVKKAIAFYKANGKDKAFSEISNPQGQFVKDDLYIFVYDMNGKCMAHGFNKAMIGKDLKEMKDPDGVYFVKERIELAKTKGKGWQDYKFTNPGTKKIEKKTAYIEKVDDYIFGCGAYKQ